MTAFVEQLGSVQDRFPTKDTIKEMAEKRDIIQNNQEERLKTVESDVKKLNAKWNWMAGLGSAALLILGVIEAFIQAGKL